MSHRAHVYRTAASPFRLAERAWAPGHRHRAGVPSRLWFLRFNYLAKKLKTSKNYAFGGTLCSLSQSSFVFLIENTRPYLLVSLFLLGACARALSPFSLFLLRAYSLQSGLGVPLRWHVHVSVGLVHRALKGCHVCCV